MTGINLPYMTEGKTDSSLNNGHVIHHMRAAAILVSSEALFIYWEAAVCVVCGETTCLLVHVLGNRPHWPQVKPPLHARTSVMHHR